MEWGWKEKEKERQRQSQGSPQPGLRERLGSASPAISPQSPEVSTCITGDTKAVESPF